MYFASDTLPRHSASALVVQVLVQLPSPFSEPWLGTRECCHWGGGRSPVKRSAVCPPAWHSHLAANSASTVRLQQAHAGGFLPLVHRMHTAQKDLSLAFSERKTHLSQTNGDSSKAVDMTIPPINLVFTFFEPPLLFLTPVGICMSHAVDLSKQLEAPSEWRASAAPWHQATSPSFS